MSEQYVVPKQVDWYDEQTLAAIFEEIRSSIFCPFVEARDA